MPQGPEQEPISDVSDVIQERQEDLPEPASELKEAGIEHVPSQVTAQVTDDDTGKLLMQSPATKTVTVTIPASQKQLDDWAKGSPVDALTWFASFWLRIIKKALHFGWKIITKGGK
jgi:hypothetical protein